MASLKSFLYGAAPILGLTGATLYERQRALVNLGALEATRGRGPGSGVRLTAYNIAAVLISVLATHNLSEVDEQVVALINARPEMPRFRGPAERDAVREHVKQNHAKWVEAGRPTFCSSIAAVLAGEHPPWPIDYPVQEICVKRPDKGILSSGFRDHETEFRAKSKITARPLARIDISAALSIEVINELTSFTRGALTQADAEEDEE